MGGCLNPQYRSSGFLEINKMLIFYRHLNFIRNDDDEMIMNLLPNSRFFLLINKIRIYKNIKFRDSKFCLKALFIFTVLADISFSEHFLVSTLIVFRNLTN